jgi:hypothetical protein
MRALQVRGAPQAQNSKSITGFTVVRGNMVLRSWLLLLLLEEGEQGNARDLHDLETDTGNISHSVALTTEPRNQHLILQRKRVLISSRQLRGTTSVTR